jgi:S-adenosyl-L-methionine hydrolase (adenosine-forming)
MGIITLITDFGLEDEYVGVMKGVILGIDPSAVIVDVTHAIEPRDVIQAAYMVGAACRHFSEGTIHLVVVDPGVGTGRCLLCLEMEGRIFLAPDNGVLTLPLRRPGTAALRRVENSSLWRSEIGRTFHGRDILSPVAAHLSRGVPVEAVGPPVEPGAAVMIADLGARITAPGQIAGKVVHVDRFGNLITDIDRDLLRLSGACAAGPAARVSIGSRLIRGISGTYADVEAGLPVALIGSRGCLEIAVNAGSARTFFRSRKGDPVRVQI